MSREQEPVQREREAKDYRVTVKVRNANLLRAIEAAGEEPGQRFANKVGISYHYLNKLINMTVAPRYKDGEYKPGVMALCEYLNKMPMELFSDEQHEALDTNMAEFDASLDEVQQIACGEVEPDRLLIASEAVASLHSLMEAVLTEREQRTLDMRFGITGDIHTLDEVAAAFGIGRERTRQIEAKAIRKLHTTCERRGLQSVLEGVIQT